MKTEVIMKRELFGKEISQRSKSEFFSATDLVSAANRERVIKDEPLFNFSAWLNKKTTLDFIEELKEVVGGEVMIRSKGKGSHTWMHPYLFIDLALTISPKLKIKVYNWLYDYLLEYRNSSGDSYKKMSGALYNNTKAPTIFYKEIADIANRIKSACGVNDWQYATENELKLRNKIHENISLLCDVLNDNEMAVEIGIDRALKEVADTESQLENDLDKTV